MNPTVEYWPLAATLALLTASLGLLFLLRRQVNRESGDNEARTARALQSARNAAARMSRDRRPLRWARAQTQIAMLLTQAGGGIDGRDRLSEACKILAAVIPVFEAMRKTGEWATAVYYLGRAEWEISMVESDNAGLETAAATFLNLLSLKPWPRHLSRAIIVTLPAVILADLGQRQGEQATIEKGVALCREAVAVARRRVAVEWCAVHRNLCHVLTILGRYADNPALLEEAVAAGREATAATRQTRDPGQWTDSRICLGHALCTLGELSGDADILQEGVAGLEDIRRMSDPRFEHEGRIMVAQPLGSALMAAGRLTGNRVALRRALQELIVALKLFDRLGWNFARAETERMTGLALASLGAIEKDTAVRLEAAAHYQAALEIFEAAGASRQATETKSAIHHLENDAGELPTANFTPSYTVR